MLLSRTADSLFWTARYIERAESTARLLEAATRLSNVRSGEGEPSNEWESAVLATGMEKLFEDRYGEANARTVVDFLAFSEANPSSIRSCLEAARANARSVRTAITIEMWETINAAWLELKRYRTYGQSRAELLEFLRFVKQVALSVDGIAHRTMLRTDGFSFFQLGGAIERADNTARILDVKYHVLLPKGDRVGGGLDYFQWTSILRSVSALTAYHWVYRESLKPWLVADLLILNEAMPRSLSSCYGNITRDLDKLSKTYGKQGKAQRMARAIHSDFRNRKVESIFQSGLHEFVEDFIARNNTLGATIAEQYLFE
ncbi:MAG: alpha-E domain-containing protein [Devosiaceae bacterium]|nr:alpha-E domain-containing protein [Devosiaceae bacterium MH13]